MTRPAVADSRLSLTGLAQMRYSRHANQEVTYLLLRIETFNGIAILASGLKGSMDVASRRRFESIIHFAMPGTNESRSRFDAMLDQKWANKND